MSFPNLYISSFRFPVRKVDSPVFYRFVLLFLCSFTLFSLPAQVKISVTEDTYVRGGIHANTNYGDSTIIRVKRSGSEDFKRKAFLKFEVSGQTSIHSAKVFFYGRAQSIMNVTAYAVEEDVWEEGSMTWANAPSLGDIYGSFRLGASDQWYSLDVTTALQDQLNAGDSIFSVGFDDPNATNQTVTLTSKEADPTRAAYLEINGVPTNNTPKDVYLIIGQSNTAGRGAIEAKDQVALTGVDLFNGTNWEPATNPMNAYSTIRKDLGIQGLSYAYTFGKVTHEVTGRQLGLIVNARGGTRISQWTKGSVDGFFEAAVARVNAALGAGDSLRGILWHQGESNRNSASYLTNLQQLIEDFRAAFGIPNLPFIAGQLSQERPENAIFNANLTSLPTRVPHTDFVHTDDLGTTDLTHFNANGQRVLGHRYAAKVLQMSYGYPLKTKIIAIDQDAYTRAGGNAHTIYGQDSTVIIEHAGGVNGNPQVGYLTVDLSEINGQIIDAYVQVLGQVAGGTEDIILGVSEVDSSWDEQTLTYANAPLLDTRIDTFHYSGSTWTGRSIFVSEYAEEIGNGLLSIGMKAEEIGPAQFRFYSQEHPSGNGPLLQVDFIETKLSTGMLLPEAEGAFPRPEIQVYPNPGSQGEITITGIFPGEKILMTDMLGRAVLQLMAEGQALTVNIGTLPRGSYVIRGAHDVKRWVKQ